MVVGVRGVLAGLEKVREGPCDDFTRVKGGCGGGGGGCGDDHHLPDRRRNSKNL